jgi:hypothetical protein
MAVCGPIADAIGLHATLRWMSAIGIAAALFWAVQPSVRRLRRPRPAAPVTVLEAPPPAPPAQAAEPVERPAARNWVAWLLAAGLAAALLGSRRRPG